MYSLEIAGNGISETLNLKILWGSMPPNPPSSKILQQYKLSSRAYTSAEVMPGIRMTKNSIVQTDSNELFLSENIPDFSPDVGIIVYRRSALHFPGEGASAAAWRGTSKLSAYLRRGTYTECTLVIIRR